MNSSARFALAAVLLSSPVIGRGQVTEPPVPEAKPSAPAKPAAAAGPIVKFKAGPKSPPLREVLLQESIPALVEQNVPVFR